MTVVAPGTELDLLRPMKVKVIPGVGPATAERLRRAGIHTVADLEAVSEDELVRLLGQAHGHGLCTPGPRPGRPAGRRRAGDQVDQRRGHLRLRPHRPQADGGAADPAGPRGGHPDAQERHLRAHGHHQGPPLRLHHPQPVEHPHQPHRRRRDHRPASRAPCSPTSTPPAAYASSASASPASPTGCRRTSSARRPRTRRSRWCSPEPPRRTWPPGRGRRARRDGRGLGLGLRLGAW